MQVEINGQTIETDQVKITVDTTNLLINPMGVTAYEIDMEPKDGETWQFNQLK